MNTIPESYHKPLMAGARPARTTMRGTKRQTWMVSFADLMAILLTFMVVSFSTRGINEAPWQHISQSMQETFKVATGPDAGPSPVGPVDGLASDASDEVVADLITGRFPEFSAPGVMTLSAQGVEIDLALAEKEGHSPESIGDYLVSLNRSLLVQVEASLPQDNPGSVQRTLAWEEGLMMASDLRLRLLEQGLKQGAQQASVREPRISVTMAKGQGSTKFVVESVRGGGQ